MATAEERIRILKMVQDGKLTADQAAELIDAVDSTGQTAQETKTTENTGTASPKNARWFNVRVTNISDNKKRVNVRLPVGMVKAGIKMGSKFAPEVQDLDVDELINFINSGDTGQFVDVVDEEEGSHIEVFIE